MSQYDGIILLGPPGSGKEHVVNYFKKFHDFYFLPDSINDLVSFKNEIDEAFNRKEYYPETQLIVVHKFPRNLAEIMPLSKIINVTQIAYFDIGSEYEQVKERAVSNIFRSNAKSEKEMIESVKSYFDNGMNKIVENYRNDENFHVVPGGKKPAAMNMSAEKYALSVMTKLHPL